MQKQINPLDFKPDVAIGLALPMNKANGGVFALNYTSADQAKSNLRNLLLTEPGERPMHPNFGVGFKRSLFQQNTGELVVELETKINQQVEYWLPYITIQDIQITPDVDRYLIYIKIFFTMYENENEVFDISLEPIVSRV